MEKIEYHNDEERQACKYIHEKRKYNRDNFKQKTIFYDCGFFDGCDINSIVSAHYNMKTGTISISSFGLGVNFEGLNFRVHPSTNTPLRCTNEHGLDAHRKHKIWRNTAYYNFVFSSKISKGYRIVEELRYHKINGEIQFTSFFRINK